MSMDGLGSKILGGASWMVGFRFAQRSLGIVSTIILARLLVPEDFGLVAMAVVVFGILELMGAFGFDLALIRDQKASRRHYDTAWTCNLIYFSVSGLVFALCAPIVADFFGDPRLIPIVYVLAFVAVLQGFENIGVVGFRKELRFHKEFQFQVIKKLVAFTVTVILAFMLRNYWALVWGMLASRASGVALSFAMHPYRPRPSLSAVRELFGFSSWVLLNNLATYTRGRGPDLIIGRLSGADALGVYRIAKEIAMLPNSELYQPIMRAVFPGFSKVSSDLSRLRPIYADVQGAVATVTVPASIGIVMLADPIVTLLLGQNWLLAIPVIQVLGLAGVIQVLQGNRFSLFMALGQPYWITIMLLLEASVMLPLMAYLLVQGYGIEVAVWARVVGALVVMPLGLVLVTKKLEMSASRLSSALWRPVVATGVMALALHMILRELPEPSSELSALIQLVVCVPAGVGIYSAALISFWFVAGRPEGSESRVLGLIGLGRLRRVERLS